MATFLSSKEIVIEESIDYEIDQKMLQDAIVDPVMEIGIEESNHAEEFYVETIQNLDACCRDLVSYEDTKLINFEVASKIKKQEDMFSGDDSYYILKLSIF